MEEVKYEEEKVFAGKAAWFVHFCEWNYCYDELGRKNTFEEEAKTVSSEQISERSVV